MPVKNSAEITEPVLVIGASGGIAQAIIAGLQNAPVTAISSKPEPEHSSANNWFISDYSEPNISMICEQLKSKDKKFTRIFICNGQLHNKQFNPEKRLKDINQQQLQQIFFSNTIVPALWLKHLPDLLAKDKPSTVTVFSARVGSITDNKIGGWYSYRASKAALNMLVRTTAIELQRLAPKARIICFHPGTTDTALSKPFQKNVPAGKLFSASFVAEQLLKLIDKNDLQHGFYDWAHNHVEW